MKSITSLKNHVIDILHIFSLGVRSSFFQYFSALHCFLADFFFFYIFSFSFSEVVVDCCFRLFAVLKIMMLFM